MDAVDFRLLDDLGIGSPPAVGDTRRAVARRRSRRDIRSRYEHTALTRHARRAHRRLLLVRVDAAKTEA